MRPRVLIVDDSLTVRMDLGEAFGDADFQAVPCATAAAARSELARGTFALVVLDVLLPDCDGVEFLKELRSDPATEGLPVMLLSSESEVKDRVRGLRTGASEYVGKPYDAGYVVARAKELVRGAEPVSAADTTTILLIEDSRTFREEMKLALEAAGYAVVAAVTGEEGLRVAADLRPAAVVVDGQLPGIDGATVVRRIRLDGVLRRTPCLLLTASAERFDELRALDAGADAYVRKDEDAGLILARLGAMLRSADVQTLSGPTRSLLSPKKVLAVDDSPTYLEALADRLRQEGYEVVLARSGEQALELLPVQPVDCILLDFMLPGLSGHETCRRIKSSPGWRHVPVVMLTALEDRQAMIQGISAGADDYISKSSDFEVLSARLRAQIRRKYFEDENRHIREQLLQSERQVRRLAGLRAINVATAASLDLGVILDVFLEHATAQLSVDAADVLLFRSPASGLEYAASRGFLTTALQYTRLRLGEGLAGRVAFERRPVSVTDLGAEPRSLGRSLLLPEEGFVAYYALPLLAKGQLRGVLELFHRSALDLNPEWLEFVHTLADQAAVAIDGALLFEDLQRSYLNLDLAYDATLEGWSRALDLRDHETEGHTQRVTELTLRLGRALGMSEAELVQVRRGALLHDIGKMGIPDRILLKPGPLSDEEWEVMRRHPVYAYELLSPIEYLRAALDIPYCHHEKWDGTGYPRGLKGEMIPLAARAFAVVDVWDALRSDRPYRPAWVEERVRQHVRTLAGTHFDPAIVEVFLAEFEDVLSSGKTAPNSGLEPSEIHGVRGNP